MVVLNIVLLGGAIATLSGLGGGWLRRALRGFGIGLAVAMLLAPIMLLVTWTTDRPHFFDDGGPIGALLVVETYVGLPSAVLGSVLSVAARTAMKLIARISA